MRTGSNFLIFIALLVIGFIIHALVLRFVFPGYYDPLSPNHEDFYIPVAFAFAPNNGYGYGDLMNWTRPLFMMFYKASGYAGFEGAVAFVISLVIANCALTALLIKRLLNFSFNGFFILTFGIYCFLLFSMPYFYIFYTEDPGSHLSYFFLILAGFSVIFLVNKQLWLSLFLATMLSILGYLSKETYELVALFFSGLWFIYYRRESIMKALVPVIATVVGIAVSVLNNMRLKSVFVNPEAGEDNPYKMDLSPYSVLREMWRYFREGMNFANILLIGLIGYLVFLFFRNKGNRSRELLFLTVACLAAPFLAWLPNALLPNHHYGGYSFNGLYLFYLPVFFVPFLRFLKPVSVTTLIILGILIPVSHLLNYKKYKDSTHNAVLIYESTLRNFHNALDTLIGKIQPGSKPERILIKGITFPFNAFVYPESLREFPNAPYANYDVVNYTGKFRYEGRRDLVRYINEEDTGFAQYNRIWIFNNDGRLVLAQENPSVANNFKSSGDSTGVLLTLDNLPDFKISGIYSPESGIAWTDGNVTIELNTPIRKDDTINVKLTTYLPEVCKDVYPTLELVDINGVAYKAVQSRKSEFNFYYRFATEGTKINRVTITAPKLPTSETDKRILSFPFGELYIR